MRFYFDYLRNMGHVLVVLRIKAGKVYLMSRLNKHLSEGRENLEDLEKQVWLVKSWKL